MSAVREGADGEVWRSFKQLLDSPATITLPPETLHGAISHFLATRPLDTLPEVINTILASKSLWATGSQGHEARDAVRLAVSSKQQVVRQSLTKAYFPACRERKQLQQWLSAVGARLVDADDTGERAQILLGLVEGMKDTPDAEWGIMRDTLEDELVVAVAGLGTPPALSTSQLDFLCAAIVVVEEARLEVLNVEAFPLVLEVHSQEMAHRLQQDLLSRLSAPSAGADARTESRARALGRLLHFLDAGEAEARVAAWNMMQGTCDGVQRLAEQNSIPAAGSALILLHDVVHILVASSPPSLPSTSRTTSHPAAEMATTIVAALCGLVQTTTGEVQSAEDFQPVLFGSLDIIEAKGGETGADDLIRHLSTSSSSQSPGGASFVLSVGEQMATGISASTLRDILLPLTQRYMREPEHGASFEAAHAFCLAMIKASVGSSARDRAQDDFMREFIPAYARSLLMLAAETSITADQLRSAYPVACNGAAHVDHHTLSSCIKLLLESIHRTDTFTPFAQSLRLTRISVAPCLPSDELGGYLERLAWNILDTPAYSADRTELVNAVFEMIVKDLPDEGKRTGIEWWLRWQRALAGRSEAAPMQAKL